LIALIANARRSARFSFALASEPKTSRFDSAVYGSPNPEDRT